MEKIAGEAFGVNYNGQYFDVEKTKNYFLGCPDKIEFEKIHFKFRKIAYKITPITTNYFQPLLIRLLL